MAATVELSGVGKRFRTTEAVRNVSFVLGEGETVALLGHNGAGKTTLMKLMLGLLRPTAGEIRVLGKDPATGGFEMRRRVGYLPENVAFSPAMTGLETLRFYARLKRRPESELIPLLERVDLAASATRRVGTYSKGMRQRLGLAQALLGDPVLLFLDEPTTGLDPASRQNFYDLVEQARAAGATVLLSSHALTELAHRAGRVIIMDHGDMLADGSIDALRRLAQLPTRIEVTVCGAAPAAAKASLDATGADWRMTADGAFVTKTRGADKIELLRRTMAVDLPLSDVAVTPPSLDELYAHFLRQGRP